MKLSVVFVAASLAAAILILASLLILTKAHSEDETVLSGRTILLTPTTAPSQPFWNIKNAPAAIKAKPTA